MNKISKIFLVTIFSVILFGCGKKPTTTAPTPQPKVYEIPLDQRPYVSITPRRYGHMLYLKIINIPSNISQIEYELLYTAIDNGNEIEKGVGDTIKEINKSVERSLLLGTESCTNGCKYKYDTGIVGGTITLSFISNNNQIATYQAPFTLKSATDIKKDNNTISLSAENFSIKATIAGGGYYVLLKNYNNNYSVFGSSATNSKFVSISPDTITKSTPSLVGDYLISQ